MTFKKKCASHDLHMEWGCPAVPRGALVLGKMIPVKVKNKLLELVGKKETRYYYKTGPKFCKGCVDEAHRRYPQLTVRESSADSELHASLDDLPVEDAPPCTISGAVSEPSTEQEQCSSLENLSVEEPSPSTSFTVAETSTKPALYPFLDDCSDEDPIASPSHLLVEDEPASKKPKQEKIDVSTLTPEERKHLARDIATCELNDI